MGGRAVSVYNFQPVRHYASKRGTCPSCGKTTVRKTVFEQTISPFNRNEDGTQRTPDEVRAAVNAEADQWVPDFRHNTDKCAA